MSSQVTLSDSRTLAWVEYGDPTGTAVLNHHGGLLSGSDVAPLDEAARASGVRPDLLRPPRDRRVEPRSWPDDPRRSRRRAGVAGTPRSWRRSPARLVDGWPVRPGHGPPSRRTSRADGRRRWLPAVGRPARSPSSTRWTNGSRPWPRTTCDGFGPRPRSGEGWPDSPLGRGRRPRPAASPTWMSRRSAPTRTAWPAPPTTPRSRPTAGSRSIAPWVRPGASPSPSSGPRWMSGRDRRPSRANGLGTADGGWPAHREPPHGRGRGPLLVAQPCARGVRCAARLNTVAIGMVHGTDHQMVSRWTGMRSHLGVVLWLRTTIRH